MNNGDDMFTSMRNILKEESLNNSKLESQSKLDSKFDEEESSNRGKKKIKKMMTNMKNLRKEQNKFKKQLEG